MRRDIWLAAILAGGCGKWGFDPVGGDGGGPPGPVTLRVFDDDGVPQRIDVLFHDADGRFLAVVPTAPDGSATSVVPSGGMVTAMRMDEDIHFETIVGVEPGDVLVMGRPDDVTAIVGDVAVTLSGPATNAVGYAVHHSCDVDILFNAAATSSMTYQASCAPQNRGAVLVLAYDAADDVTAYSGAVDIPLQVAQTSSVTMPGWTTTWDVLTVDVQNTPPGTSDVFIEVADLRDGVTFDLSDDERPTSTASIPVFRVSGFANGLGLSATAAVGAGETGVYRRTLEATATTTRVVDLGAALPALLIITVVPDPQGRPSVRAIADGDLASSDGGMLEVTWLAGPMDVVWQMVVPPGRLIATVPELPEFLANLRPTTSSVFRTPRGAFVDVDFAAGYAELRRSDRWLEPRSSTATTLDMRYTEINDALFPLLL